MRRYLMAIFFLIVSVCLNGQMRFGRVFGINISEMTFNSAGVSVDPSSMTGIHFGGCVDLPIKGGFTFQPGAFFSSKGATYEMDTVAYLLSPIYIEAPLNLVYMIGSEEFRISVYAGPYIAIGIDGMKIDGSNPSRGISYGSGQSKDLDFFDLGMNFGAGVCFRGLMISAQYGIGLSNIAPEAHGDVEIKNNVIGISLASFVTRKK